MHFVAGIPYMGRVLSCWEGPDAGVSLVVVVVISRLRLGPPGLSTGM